MYQYGRNICEWKWGVPVIELFTFRDGARWRIKFSFNFITTFSIWLWCLFFRILWKYMTSMKKPLPLYNTFLQCFLHVYTLLFGQNRISKYALFYFISFLLSYVALLTPPSYWTYFTTSIRFCDGHFLSFVYFITNWSPSTCRCLVPLLARKRSLSIPLGFLYLQCGVFHFGTYSSPVIKIE